MKVYGDVAFSEGSDVVNLSLNHGQVLPSSPNIGELFYHDNLGLLFHNGVSWNPVSTDVHVFNDVFSTEAVSGNISKIIPSSAFKAGSTQLYIGGMRQKLNVDYSEQSGYLTLNYNLSTGEVASGVNIVLDFIKSLTI